MVGQAVAARTGDEAAATTACQWMDLAAQSGELGDLLVGVAAPVAAGMRCVGKGSVVGKAGLGAAEEAETAGRTGSAGIGYSAANYLEGKLLVPGWGFVAGTRSSFAVSCPVPDLATERFLKEGLALSAEVGKPDIRSGLSSAVAEVGRIGIAVFAGLAGVGRDCTGIPHLRCCSYPPCLHGLVGACY